LVHLHSVDYPFPAGVCRVLGCDADDVSGIQSTLTRWIKSLEPSTDLPQQGRAKQLHQVLHHRFVLGLTQEETAHNLYMSTRTLQRVQRNAVHLLARRIWDAHQAQAALKERGDPQTPVSPATWEAQVQQELRSLQQSFSRTTASLRDVIRGALHIAKESLQDIDVALDVDEDELENCYIQLAMSIAEQVILIVLAALEQAVPGGEIGLSVVVEGSHALITFRASPVPAEFEVDLAFAHELIGPQGGSLTLSGEGDELAVTLRLPRAERVGDRATVLVVDDNVDLVTLYASYCKGTDYDVIHVGRGSRLFEVVTEQRPDVILLDVLLPDANGWQLLIDLQTTPETRDIPVIVCSVITDAQMALDLGAALYLQKPVWRQQLVDALDQVLTASPT
jgi:CheY-like chemotaxis protein